MVAERTVVGVLGNGHQLHCVVARAANFGQYLAREFAVGTHTRLLLRHTHVCLVDQQRAERLGVEVVALPIELLGRCPKLSREILRLFVLHDASGVCGDTIVPTVVAVNGHFICRAVSKFVAIHSIGQEDAPYAALAAMQLQFATSPIVEITKQIDLLGCGQPFAEPPTRKNFVALPAIITIAISVVDDRACGTFDLEHLVDI